ncbi:MAG TPA: FHIPEP family type III secretion protein [Aldersonia sp.]
MSHPARPDTEDPDQDDLNVATRKIVDQAIEELRDEANLSTVTKALTQTVLRGLKRRGDYDDIVGDLDRIRSDLGRTNAILSRCAEAVRREEERVALKSPGSTVWWKIRRRAVIRAVKKGRPDEALRRWTTVWVEGLAMGDWGHCREVLSLPGLPSDIEQIRKWMHAVTDALANGRYAAALDALDGLLDPGIPTGNQLEIGAAVPLGVLRVRILSRELSDRDVIREAAEATVVRAGDSAWQALALAALAETQLAANDIDATQRTLERAGQIDGAVIDVLIISGLLREQEGLWSSADQSYDDAVRIDRAGAVQPVLLRPVPARLLVRAAVSPGLPVTDAVDLLEQASAQDTSDGDSWKREVQLALAEKLVQLAQDDDGCGRVSAALDHRLAAAKLFVEAGQRFSWSGLTVRAVELFDRACQLAPDVAEFRWEHSEGLRLDALHVDGTVDLRALETAREQVEYGLSLRQPRDGESWVLVTQALIEEELPDPHHDPDLLVERALLRAPSYATGYGFLAGILRRQGFVQEAVEASGDGRKTAEASNPILFDEHLSLMLDLGRYDEALKLVEYQSLWQPDLKVAWYRAKVSLHQLRPDDALAALSGQDLTDPMRLLRGFCLFAAGDVEGSRDEYRSLWNDTRSGPTGDIAGWAAFQAGLLDEAIVIYRGLRARAPARTAFTRDLGLMKLVRGDVAEGASLLKEGISACPFPAELRLLAAVEFDFVRRATADERHGVEVAAILADLGPIINRRCDDLLGARRRVGSVPALLSTARLAMHAGRPMDALAVYANLIGRDDVPEAVAAAAAAARSARDLADLLFTADHHDKARSQWSAAEHAIVRISADVDPDLLWSLVCRRMLADLVDGSQDDIAEWLNEVQLDPDRESALTEAAGALAHDPTTLWSLRDGLLELYCRPDVSADGRRLALAVVDRLPLTKVYSLDAAAAADALLSRFLLVNPLELRFGTAVDELCDSPWLTQATKDLQTRIEAEMGVRLPWVKPVAAPRLADRQVDVRVYGSRVGSTVLAGTGDSWVPQVMKVLEDRVRGYVFRFVGVDDVALWLEGWGPSTGDAPTWDPTDPSADRLRLARVLRMLLREQVSVGNRDAIVEAVRSPAGLEKRGESATLNTLLDARRRLGSSALGIGPGTAWVSLPSELEERVAAGLPPDRPVWELPRLEAARLVADLRAWLRAQPASPRTIIVTDARTRPFVWRLVAAERPTVRVLSEDELSLVGPPS